jgi:hypothetical protein
VSTPEDEEAKNRVKAAVWEYTQQGVVLAVVFLAGLFTGYFTWGSGTEGAVHLRQYVKDQDAQLLDCKNKRVDLQSRLDVIQRRYDECTQRAAGAAR